MWFFTQEWRVAKESYYPSKDLMVYNLYPFLSFEKDQQLIILPYEKSNVRNFPDMVYKCYNYLHLIFRTYCLWSIKTQEK